MSIRLVQLQKGTQRRLAFVEEPRLRLFEAIHTTFDLVRTPLGMHASLADLIEDALGDELLDYEAIYAGKSEWKILPPMDHPEPSRLIVSGTGLTHLGSAKNRDAMHEKKDERQKTKDEIENQKLKIENLTDSMKMHQWGLERGRPGHGQIGVAPEWFYKGTGALLRAHNEALEWPAHAEDGGEEGEIAGVYIIDAHGNPVRAGMAQGNEFSDHVFEKKNYLNLAGSKLRTSSLGPELVIAPKFDSIVGEARILRGAAGHESVVWAKPLATGEAEMCHSLANIEHHHFKFENHRRPGDVHVHFFGTCALSFADGIRMQDGDVMEVSFKGFGRPLRNPLRIDSATQRLVSVRQLS